MAAWTAPDGDGEATMAALIATVAAGMATMLWTQRAPAGDPAVDAACVLSLVVALTAAGAGATRLLRRRRGSAATRRAAAG